MTKLLYSLNSDSEGDEGSNLVFSDDSGGDSDHDGSSDDGGDCGDSDDVGNAEENGDISGAVFSDCHVSLSSTCCHCSDTHKRLEIHIGPGTT